MFVLSSFGGFRSSSGLLHADLTCAITLSGFVCKYLGLVDDDIDLKGTEDDRGPDGSELVFEGSDVFVFGLPRFGNAFHFTSGGFIKIV